MTPTQVWRPDHVPRWSTTRTQDRRHYAGHPAIAGTRRSGADERGGGKETSAGLRRLAVNDPDRRQWRATGPHDVQQDADRELTHAPSVPAVARADGNQAA